MSRDAAGLVLCCSRCSESYQMTLSPSLGLRHYLRVQVRWSFSAVLNITHLKCEYSKYCSNISAAEDKAGTKTPCCTEMGNNISTRTAPQHVTGITLSLKMVSHCTLHSVFFVNNLLSTALKTRHSLAYSSTSCPHLTAGFTFFYNGLNLGRYIERSKKCGCLANSACFSCVTGVTTINTGIISKHTCVLFSISVFHK